MRLSSVILGLLPIIGVCGCVGPHERTAFHDPSASPTGMTSDGTAASSGGNPTNRWTIPTTHSGPHSGSYLEIGGRLAADYLHYDRRNVRDREVELGEAELRADGEVVETLRFRLVGDLLGRDSRGGFREAWLSHEIDPAARVTLGLLPTTTGIEHSFDEWSHSFIGYGFQANLDGRTDLGLRLDGELLDGGLSYAVTGLVGEGFDFNGERRSGPQGVVRLASYPVRLVADSAPTVAEGFFLNAGLRYGTEFEGQFDVAHPFRNKIFRTTRLEGDDLCFYHFGYGFDWGPLRLTHEWTWGGIDDVETPTGGRVDLDDQITAMTVTGAWMITGERYDSRPYRQRENPRRRLPARPVFHLFEDPDTGPTGWGAWEVAVRYSNADIDRRFFSSGFTTFQDSSQEFRTFTVALNWFVARNLRATGQFVRTIADQRPAVFDSHGRDSSFLFRVQLQF